MTSHVRHIALLALLAGALSACGGGSSGGSSPRSAGASAQPAASGTTIAVTEKEFAIAVAAHSLQAGTYTFHVTNAGKFAHNLTIDGPGVSNAATPTFAGGGSKDLKVTLRRGAYTLFCSVPGHRQQGMVTTLEVT